MVDMSIEEFMAGEASGDASDGEDVFENLEKTSDVEDETGSVVSREDAEDEPERHKESLHRLKETDPDFYHFLEENDRELLQFDYSSGGSDDDDEEERHVPPERLEVDSEASDTDEHADGSASDDDGEQRTKLTVELISAWRKKLTEEKKPLETIGEVVAAFKQLVQQLSSEGSKHRDIGGPAFNRLMNLCIGDMASTFNRLVSVADGKTSFVPSQSKVWTRLQPHVNAYLTQLVKILPEVASPALTKVLLKHVLQLVPYWVVFSKLSKALLKKLIQLWSTGEESVRVLAFLCIIRLAHKLPQETLVNVTKLMYLAYVKNCKFTSPSTWPLINFMKHSLVEVLAVNDAVAYQQAFVNVRQLAIHLRNAISVKKKDSIKTVYNWQFVHCLYFWSHFLAKRHGVEALRPLIHPLTQIITGTIKLVPVAKYIPLRYHCLRSLIVLSRDTGTFVPILPFLIESLDLVDFNRKNSRVSWKPLDFTCAVKLSKSQLDENGFKDAVMDQFYELIMDYSSTVSHRVGFPELVLTTVVQMRAFTKRCKTANYNKQMKQLLEKVTENSTYITEKRKAVTFSIADTKAVENFETETKQSGTPLLAYYAKYRKLRDKEIEAAMSQKEQLDDCDLPPIQRKQLAEAKKAKDREEFADLFEGGSDDSDDDEFCKHGGKETIL